MYAHAYACAHTHMHAVHIWCETQEHKTISNWCCLGHIDFRVIVLREAAFLGQFFD